MRCLRRGGAEIGAGIRSSEFECVRLRLLSLIAIVGAESVDIVNSGNVVDEQVRGHREYRGCRYDAETCVA